MGSLLQGGAGRLPLPSVRPQWQGVLGHWQWVTFPGCVPDALALMEAGEREGGKGDSRHRALCHRGGSTLWSTHPDWGGICSPVHPGQAE